MINLLRYADRAAYPEGFAAEPCSGREAYDRYRELVMPRLEAVGGAPVWAAAVGPTVIGAAGEEWDDAFLIRYPSKQAFLEMATDDSYLSEVAPHRSAALADSRLICCPEA